jgi:CelD/BcsL family acetyltransferase involved in cellulose biosynthesis
MGNKASAPPLAVKGEAIRLERIPLATASESLLSEWKEFEANSTPDSPTRDPDWLRGYFLEDLDKITSYLLYNRSDSVSGSASFLLKEDWPLRLHLGELTIAELPLRRLRFLGGAPALPEDESLYDRLFRELIATEGYDALCFTQIPVESFLWKYVTTSRLVREEFYRYKPEDASPHPLLRFGASFEEYMKSNFSANHRYKLRRKVTKFQEKAVGGLKLVRCTRPEDVARFLDAAVQVSRKTYQWNLHQRGLSATERFERRFRFAAEHGWFRSYLLICGETPCAFLGGYQWRGRYYHDELGFDPAFTQHNPGTVLQLMAIQDMFNYQRPEFIDFGSYDEYKEELATESYFHCDMMLLRRRPYCRFVQAAHYACRLTTRVAVRVLRGLNLKSRLKKLVRDRSVRAEQAPAASGEQRR